MEYEDERLLKLVFPKLPENLEDDPNLSRYLYKLGTYKVDQLKKEQTRLADENKQVVEQTQDLAISNYKTFIQTSECSRMLANEFVETEKRVDCLIEKLPIFTTKCEQFINRSSEINTARRLNSLTLKKNAQLLEILELPQLMDSCIKEGKYEEALELAAYVQQMGAKLGHIPVIESIVLAIESSWHTMLVQLLAQLRTDLQLPRCLQVVGYLRRMQAFTTPELKLKFLQARDSWLKEILSNIPRDNAQQHLTKTIELTRVNLFSIITQYKAIFSDTSSTDEKLTSDCSKIFHSWLNEKIATFLQTLEQDLAQPGVQQSLDTILGQCMYFGLSFSRIGADFRGLMVPIFVKTILQNFQGSIYKVTKEFETNIENYTLINKLHTFARTRYEDKNAEEAAGNQPPETLLDFKPLAVYCNGLLNAFNDLRLCSPIAIADAVTKLLQSSLEAVCRNILSFYRQEQQAFSASERENFIRFCSSFAFDLIPFVQRCVHLIFPPSVLAQHLGVNVMALQKQMLTYLKQKDIVLPLEHLLPDRVEAVLLQQQTQKSEGEVVEKLVSEVAEKLVVEGN